MDALLLSGTIQKGDADTLVGLVTQSDVDAVFFDSPGGDLWEGIRLANAIDRLGLDTVVTNRTICESACAIAFMGGVGRYAENGALVGVHAPYRHIDVEALARMDPLGLMDREAGNIPIRSYLNEFARYKGISQIVINWMFLSSDPQFTKKITVSEGMELGYFTGVL